MVVGSFFCPLQKDAILMSSASILDRLQFRFGTKLPLLLQSEASECGLACLGMIADYHGYHADMHNLRQRFPVSLKGATLAQLVAIASELHLSCRPLKLDMEDLPNLRLPCILHWNLQHFVVLKSVNHHSAVIHDPGFGIRKLALSELSNCFTGIALELWADTHFKKDETKQHISLRKMMGNVTGLYRSGLQILLFALALELFSLITPLYLQWILDHVLVTVDVDLLTTLAIGFALMVLLQQSVTAIRAWALLHMGTMLNVQWRSNVFRHLLRLPASYFERRHLGDVVSRFGAVDAIQKSLTTSLLEAVLDGLMSVVTLTMLFLYSPILPWVSIGVMLLYALSRWIWYAPLRSATEAQLVHAAKQQSHFLESMRGVKAIKLFGRQEERHASWMSALVNQINADLRSQKMLLAYRVINGLLFGLERVLVIWLGARLVMQGSFTAGVLVAFLAYREQFNQRVSALIDKLAEIRMLGLQGERLADIVLSEPETSPSSPMQQTVSTFSPSIELRGISFRYAEQEPFVLRDMNLNIATGESVAIVGASGCGKSTLINLMLGMLIPTEGKILIGDLPLEQVGLDRLRRMIGTVMQDDVLFAGSIADNISFFDIRADAEWIVRCAEMAAIADDISGMPMQYNTLVGDMGTVLSGGQKQRVLLARALYKKPSILFLDEATSHLDVDREQQVNAAIKALNMTRIIVAHRPETIATADRLIVLHGGKVIQDAVIPRQP